MTFAQVKSGGHTTNPGFSSTTGVHISMSHFSDITYDQEMQTVTVGAGLIWDSVYAALDPYGVNVVGARSPGVGVAGLSLGGGHMCLIQTRSTSLRLTTGYSYLTNQHGLTVDTVEAYELVMPNGTVKTVTKEDDDLFFGLRVSFIYFTCSNYHLMTTCTVREDSIILFVAFSAVVQSHSFHTQGIVTKFTLRTFPQTQVWVSVHYEKKTVSVYLIHA